MDAAAPAGSAASQSSDPAPLGTWIERIALTNFRNYAHRALDLDGRPVVLVGPNGSGKTNLLEAVSLLAAGQGLRRAPFPELARQGGDGGWAVAGRLRTREGAFEVGTGLQGVVAANPRTGRIVRIDGAAQSGSGALADLVDMVWVIPAMDGLFTGPAGDRRRFLDRLILAFDPGYRVRVGRYERAMTQRNRLLVDGSRDRTQFEGLEGILAETGVAIAAARIETLALLTAMIGERRDRDPDNPFPWAGLAIEGALEAELGVMPALDVEERFLATLARNRERDRAAGRTLDGPHRSDFLVTHGPKAIAARLGSTGEQKALLVGIVLAHAEATGRRRGGAPPLLLLLDEITAHLDERRRAALFGEIVRLRTQAWMTGTDASAFAALGEAAQRIFVTAGPG